jgi:UPF0755 protein
MRSGFHVVKGFVALIFLALVVVCGLAYRASREVNRPRTHAAAKKIITISAGASNQEIISQLRREGVIAGDLPLALWLRISARDKRFRAGDYQFKSPISPNEVLGKLVRGDVMTHRITIPEGFNRFDIARTLAEVQGLKQPPPARAEDLMVLFDRVALIKDIDPKAVNLEGYLFPDTYEYTPSTTREQLVEAMVSRFRKVYNRDMKQRASELKLNTRQVVTLASLIEKEAKVDSERELISSVYHRRLKLGSALACDPTVIYAALLAGLYRGKIYQSDLDRDSPYNTYRHAGLPPGPIASPGRRSLEAALHPAQTDYLYFVVDASRTDGSHTFSATLADHERAVAALRQSEHDQKAAGDR